MKLEDVKKVGVVGGGVMGSAIAVVTALKYETFVKEIDEIAAERALQATNRALSNMAKKGVIDQLQKEIALSRINITTDLNALSSCQVIIDAVPDDVNLKISILAELDKICSKEAIFTTTSSIPLMSTLASGSGRPDRFVGTHFSNPAHVLHFVEVAPALQTSEETTSFIMEFLTKGLGKMPVKCKDHPGQIVNYLLFPYLISAVRAYELGIASPETIDAAMKMGLGHPVGPFEILDFVGLDTQSKAWKLMYDQLKDDRFAVPVTITKMVEAGFLGRKTGRGFYWYDEKGKRLGPAVP